jgi:CHAT domain-containing protein
LSRHAPALDRASHLLAEDELPLPAELTAESTRALGWALKDLCYSSWSSEPQRAVRAAATLQRLRDAARTVGLAPALGEVDALVSWTGGIAHVIRGEMEAAIHSLDAAAALFAEIGEPRHAAQTQVPKIMALAMLGRHDDAARCGEDAQLALLAHGDNVAASKVALNLGNLHLEADRYAAAAGCFREAAVLFARVGDPEHSVMADIGLADALAALGEPDEAVRTYTGAGTRAERHAFPVLQAMVQESIALLDLVRGRYREALAGLEGSRRRYAELEMPQALAIAHKQLADAYLELRMLPEALAGHEDALGRFRALGMQVEQAWTLVQRGRALALAGQRSKSEASLAEAAVLFVGLDNTTGVAAVALAQAELALANTDGGRALALAREAASRFGQAGLVERRLRAESVQARALLVLGEVAQAKSLLDAALSEASRQHLLPVQLRCFTGRAMAAIAAGEPDAARSDLESATELFEDLQRTLPGDELRSAFQNDHLWPFQELLRLELEAHTAGRADGEAVLARLDRFRARTLSERLGVAGQREDGARQDGTEGLRARLAWLYRRLHQLDDEADASALLTAELRKTEHELLERARRARLATAAAVPARAQGGLELRRLQRLLAPTDALVEYGVHADELFACIATATDVQVVRRVAPWPQVIDAVRAVRFQIEALRHGSAPVQRHLPVLEQRAQTHLQRLHAMVWAPLTPLLAARQRVLIVPNAQLGSVPFAALHDGRHCVAEEVQIAFAPSARIALDALTRQSAPAARVLALGESTRLPHAAREAQTVARLLPQGWAFVGNEATIENLCTHASSAGVIHFACHGQFRTDNPVFSALHLHDGPLTAETIETLQLPGATVVLSGCETALSDMGAGDEMFGLTRAFLVAGAARVVAALWPVNDSTTAEFMTDFYAALRGGHSPAAALRQAQLAARQRQTHPFYWASFTLMGRW